MTQAERSATTKNEIIRCAAQRFLEEGYTKTSINSISKALGISTGNITFHFPTKEHILAELIDLLCDFQWERMEQMFQNGTDSLMAFSLELLAMAAACDQNDAAKDFFLSAFGSPLPLAIIRRYDGERAKKVFAKYCPHWTSQQHDAAEILASGVEYATLMTTEKAVPLIPRVIGAVQTLLGIYNVPQEEREKVLEAVLAIDYRPLGLQILKDFRVFVENATNDNLTRLLSHEEQK